MSVKLTMEVVIMFVLTLTGATIAHVTRDIFLQQTTPVAPVWNPTSSRVAACDEFIVDINECQIDNGGCSQLCNNTVGSYNCSCISGYELTDDNHTCIG